MFRRTAFRNRTFLLLAAPLLALLALALVLTPQASGAPGRQEVPDAPGSLSGVVTDEGGTPLPGIAVDLFIYGESTTYPANETTTDAGGAYTFPLLGAGIYYLRFEDPSGVLAPEYYENAVRFEDATGIPVAGQDVTGINATLIGGGQISGVVSTTGFDLHTGYGAAIGLYEGSNESAWTSVDQIAVPTLPYSYTFGGLAATRYAICVGAISSDFHYFQECYDNARNSRDATPIDLSPTESRTGIDIVLGDGGDAGTFSGTVTNQDGAPLEGIAVLTSPADYYDYYCDCYRYRVTGLDGTFTITDVIPGTYHLRFYDPEGRYLTSYYDPDNSGEPQEIVLSRYGAVTGLDQSLDPAALIMGAVTLRDGYPASDGYVQAFPLTDSYGYPTGTAYISPTGQYTITRQEAGLYRVTAEVDNSGDIFVGSYSVDGTNPQTVTLATAEIKTGIDIEVAAGAYDGVLNGKVTGVGEALADIRVDIYSYSGYYWPYGDDSPSATPPAALELRETEVELPAFSAENMAVDGSFFYTLTNAGGEYAIEGMLADRSYAAYFSDPAGVYASLCSQNPQAPYDCQFHFMTSISNTLTISADLPLAGRITGRVGLPAGEDRNDYRIRSYFRSWYYAWDAAVTTEINEDGTYALPGLHGGTYQVALAKLEPYYHIVQVYPDGDYIGLGEDILVEPEGTVPDINFFLNLTEHLYLPSMTR